MVNQGTLSQFSSLDYLIFVAMLGVSILIGVYYAWKGQKTTNDMLRGGQSLSSFAVGISVMASFLSATSLMGNPAEVYYYGTQFWFGTLIRIPITMWIASKFFVPVFYNLQETSTYSYLEKRFGRPLRVINGLIYLITTPLYLSLTLYAPALSLSLLTGISVWWAVIASAAVCIIYTSIGGIRAVVWTDVFQTLFVLLAMFIILGKGIYDVGLSNIWTLNNKGDRIELFNLDPNPTTRVTFWSVVIGGVFIAVPAYGLNQMTIQRYMSLPTLNDAQRALWFSAPFEFAMTCLTSFFGLVIYAKYATCDPLSVKEISTNDQILPYFVVETMKTIPGITGLFAAGLFSASLSSVSSAMNSFSAIILEDFVKKYIDPDISESKGAFYCKLMTVICGLMALVGVFLAEQFSSLITAVMSIFGLIGAPLLGIYTLGMFIPIANGRGTIIGYFAGLAINVWIFIGNLIYQPYSPSKYISVSSCVQEYENRTGNHYNPKTFGMPDQNKLAHNGDIMVLYRISFLYYSVIGACVTVAVGCVASLFWKRREGPVEGVLLTPVVADYVERRRRKLLCDELE